MKRRDRRPQSQRTQVKKVTPIALVLTVAAAILGTGLGVFVALKTEDIPLPQIAQVRCVDINNVPCPDEWATIITNALVDTPLLFSHIPLLLETPLINQGLLLRGYQRIWPGTVVVTVAPAPLVYQLQTPTALLGVLQDGRVVTLLQPQSTAPVVTLPEELRPQTIVPEWLHQTIMATTSELQPRTLTLVSPVELRITLPDATIEYILDPQEIAFGLGQMRAIVDSEQSSQLASVAGELDVRLRLPVLRRTP